MKVISLDTETTGLDLYHGCKPFFVTVYDADTDNILWWEWDVNPRTREVVYNEGHLEEIKKVILGADKIVFQNCKFDYQALRVVSKDMQQWIDKHWDWGKVEDTLFAGHLLHSNKPHDLTYMTKWYVGSSIQRFEDNLRKHTLKARLVAKRQAPDWKVAGDKRGGVALPSAKGKNKTTKRGAEDESPWKCDTWMPRQLADHLGYPDNHPWRTVLREYANTDSPATYEVWRAQMKQIEELDLVKHYRSRLKLTPIVSRMEIRGVTVNGNNLRKQTEEFKQGIEKATATCLEVARSFDYDLVLPRGGSMNHSLHHFCFGRVEPRTLFEDSDVKTQWLNLPVVKRGKKSKQPSLDSPSLYRYVDTFPPEDPRHRFSKALLERRERGTAVGYMDSYVKFWHPTDDEGFYTIHPNLNPTGSNTIRFTSANPNEQNISKKKKFNLRYCFGPPPGYEMYTWDFENLELRIPAYRAPEPLMIELFEEPNKAPFFGSYHMLVFSILHEAIWQDAIREVGFDKAAEYCKEKYKDTYYQWTKNGNFAVQYGAVAESGTADRAYHVKGGQLLIEQRFTNIKRLNREMIEHAEEHGFIYTMPRKSVDPNRGYPLWCTTTEWGGILPTVPLSYFVQGTAMEATTGTMERVDEFYAELNRKRKLRGPGYHIGMQIHDEISGIFPKGKTPTSNLHIALEVKRLMELAGDDIGVPLKVSMSYHPNNWSESVSQSS